MAQHEKVFNILVAFVIEFREFVRKKTKRFTNHKYLGIKQNLRKTGGIKCYTSD